MVQSVAVVKSVAASMLSRERLVVKSDTKVGLPTPIPKWDARDITEWVTKKPNKSPTRCPTSVVARLFVLSHRMDSVL